jgi:hypothetical protein
MRRIVLKQRGDQEDAGVADETTADNARASFTELCALARHYSALRFVMFSVFITITSALVVVEFDASKRPADGRPLLLFRISALVSWSVSPFRRYALDSFLSSISSGRIHSDLGPGVRACRSISPAVICFGVLPRHCSRLLHSSWLR